MATGNPDETLRIIFKVGTGIATVPPSADHRNGDWLETSIYDQELYMNDADGKLYTSNGGVIQSIVSPFSIGDLTDVDLTGLSTNEILQYDGADFVPVALPAGSNLGNANLTADANRTYTLVGSLDGDTFIFKAGSGASIMQIQGDGDINFYDSAAVNYLQFDQSVQTVKSAQLTVGNNGTAAQYAFKAYGKLASTSGIAGFYNSTNVNVVDVRQSTGSGTISVKNATGTTGILLSGATNGISYLNAGGRLVIGGTAASSRLNTTTVYNTNAAPSGITDGMVTYADDQTAGNSCFHTITELGDIVKLYKEAALTAADATATDGTIGTNDTITNNIRTRLNELETALQNIGILA